MPRRRSVVIVLSAVALAWGVLGAIAQEPRQAQPENQEAILMRAKLAASQRVLEGLMAEDYELLESSARMLRDIDNWPTPKRDDVYNHYSAEYRRLAEKLASLSKEKNLEGVLFTYQHLNTTCVNCHQYVRDVRPLPAGKKI